MYERKSNMSFTITHASGDMESDLSLDCFADLLTEIDGANGEHIDVALKHDSEWCLSALANGSLIWENVEGVNLPRHMKNVSKERIIELWTKLAQGEIESINSEPWLEGYY